MKHANIAVIIACAAVLAACGSGRDSVRELTGLDPAIEAPAAQIERAADVLARFDSLVLSTTHVETDLPAAPAFRLLAECGGARCTLTDALTGDSETVTTSDLEIPDLPAEALGTRHGVTLIQVAGRYRGADHASLGAWMEHGGFSFQTNGVVADGIRADSLHATAGGDLTGVPLAGSATWLGLMVATPMIGDRRGERLVGDAALNYDMDVGGLDIAFSSIKNIDRRSAHSTPTVIFADVPISAEGTFKTGSAGDRVQGGFYGPGHAEAAGIFERANMIGAFGARRQ